MIEGVAGRSVRRKLLATSLLPAGAAILVVTVAVGFYLRAQLRQDAVDSLAALASVIADNVSASVAFRDEEAANETLAALRTSPSIVAAAIYDADDVTFASFRQHPTAVVPLAPPSEIGHRFVDGGLQMALPIRPPGEDEIIGLAYVASDLREVRALSRRIWQVAAIVVSLAFGLAVLLSFSLQRMILRPIAGLAATAERVSEERDYSARVESPGPDELGRLGVAFNEMLDRIEQNDAVLTEREAYFRSLIEHSSDVITVVRADRTVAYQSPALKRVLGYESGAFVDGPVRELIHPDDRELVRHLVTESPEEGPHTMVFRSPHRDGSWRTLEAVWNGYTDSRGEHIWIINARDLTERRRIEGERERLAAQLIQAQKMEAVGQLTGGVAHDFNNLLTVIIGNMELLDLTEPLSTDSREHLRLSVDAANRGAALTQRLLAFSRKQALRPEAVDLGTLVLGLDDLFRRTLGETITVDIERDEDLWMCEVDPAQLENALLNLAINARDAMGRGGRLGIECRNVRLDGADFGGDHVEAGEYVLLSVSDTGSGMSPEVLQKVFEPFFTTKEVGKGSGLGLSMVYGFVKQSGGHVRIASTIGEGTSVSLYLPRQVAELDIPTLEPVASGNHHGNGRTVLVVEDDAGVRDLTLKLLDRLGYRTVEASDAHEALERLDEAPEIALVFTDVVLPGGMSGADLAREAAKKRQDLPVLFTSGYTRDAILRQGRLDPHIDLLQKPFTRADLARALETAFSR